MDRILVTPRSLTTSPPPVLNRLRDAGYEVVTATPGQLPDEDELLRLVPGCVGWLAGIEPVSERVIAAADRLHVISRNGAGIDNLPLSLLERRGIVTARAGGANAVGVAELTIGLMLAAARSIPASDAGIKSGGWPRHRGREINGATVGIIGCGAIGQRVAEIVIAMGAAVVAYDPLRPDFAATKRQFRWAEVADAIASADLLTLHCPAPDGGALICAETLATMRPGSILVNTARAALIDDAAVLQALDDGRLAAYATDVFDSEPPSTLALAGHPKVIATSHIGGFTCESVERATEVAVANLLEALPPP